VLRITITKKTDGSGVLHCTRADGSVTWQKQDRHAAFFALHDLTHFAVETTLNYRRAFFGLVAEGWEIEETTGKGVRRPIPEEAIEVERLVGTLDSERASHAIWTADEFNEMLAIQTSDSSRDRTRRLSDDDLARIRKCRSELYQRWFAIEPGKQLELTFG
jgi:hypothetical protein